MSEEKKDRNIVTSLLAGVGLGALIGGMVGLLFAPKPGEEMREDLKGAALKLKDKAEDLSETVSKGAHSAIEKSRDAVETVTQRVEEAIESARKAAEEKKQELVEELKDDSEDES